MLDAVEEKILLLRCLDADKEALDLLTQQYVRRFYDFTCKAGSFENSSQAQSVLLEAVAEGFRHYQPGKTRPSFFLYVLRALVKKIQTLQNAKSNQNLQNREPKIIWIASAIKSLAPRQRALILLRTQLDLLYDEMAFVFSSSVADVKKQLKESRFQFREKMDERMKAQYNELRRGSRADA